MLKGAAMREENSSVVKAMGPWKPALLVMVALVLDGAGKVVYLRMQHIEVPYTYIAKLYLYQHMKL